MREHVSEMADHLLADRNVESSPLALLRLLEKHPDLSQRQLSQALGLSLGKTHYVLHALLDKGLVKARNFRRSDRKLAYAYLLTPAGLREKLRLTRAFLISKELEFKLLQDTIAMLRREVGPEADLADRP
jgi:EPS-associated MarR family transcriptional regulator